MGGNTLIDLRKMIRFYKNKILERKLWMIDNDHWWPIIQKCGYQNVFNADYYINHYYNSIDKLCREIMCRALPRISFRYAQEEKTVKKNT